VVDPNRNKNQCPLQLCKRVKIVFRGGDAHEEERERSLGGRKTKKEWEESFFRISGGERNGTTPTTTNKTQQSDEGRAEMG